MAKSRKGQFTRTAGVKASRCVEAIKRKQAAGKISKATNPFAVCTAQAKKRKRKR